MGMNFSLYNGLSIDDDFLYAFKKRKDNEEEEQLNEGDNKVETNGEITEDERSDNERDNELDNKDKKEITEEESSDNESDNELDNKDKKEITEEESSDNESETVEQSETEKELESDSDNESETVEQSETENDENKYIKIDKTYKYLICLNKNKMMMYVECFHKDMLQIVENLRNDILKEKGFNYTIRYRWNEDCSFDDEEYLIKKYTLTSMKNNEIFKYDKVEDVIEVFIPEVLSV